MALNYDANPADLEQEVDHTSPTTRTIVGLFEDVFDVRAALEDLRKRGCDPEQVSIVFRDQETRRGPAAVRHGGVARAIDMSELNSVSQWLTHLTTVIVPERGTFLVGGPFGITLSGLNTDRANQEMPDQSALVQTLCGFGFGEDEAHYIDQRLTADALLVGVTSSDQGFASSTQEWFGDVSAVYLGSATTNSHLWTSVENLTVAPPEVFGDGNVVVTDAVAQLSGVRGSAHHLADLCGQLVIDREGQDIGSIDDIIVEATRENDAAPERTVPRYVVVVFGGMLGIGRKRAAVPITLIDLNASPARMATDRDTLQRAPAWDSDAPFSRREEHLVCAYFGVQPYWVKGDG